MRLPCPYQPPWLTLFVEKEPGIAQSVQADIMAENTVILRNITVRTVTNYGATQIGVRFDMTKEQADILRRAKAPYRLIPASNNR